MSGGVKTFLFILIIPLLLAVSHDVYLNYLSNSDKIEQIASMSVSPDEFQMTELGWVWLEYSEESYALVKESVSEKTWAKYIGPTLNMKTIIVSAAPIPIGLFLTLFAWVLGIWPFAHVHKPKKKVAPTVYTNEKTKKVKYGRK